MKQQAKNNEIEFDIGLTNFKDDQILNIKGLVVEFNVYEDIFSPVVKADFLIKDSLGLTEIFPIVGDEKIVLSFKTAGERKNLNFVFDVYKTTQRTILEERSHGYVLHGISRHGIRDLQSIVDKAYVNQPISDIVNKVFTEKLLPAGTKGLIAEETSGLQSIIATKQTPFEFISLLASEAKSAEYPETSTFVFYEDRDSFRFRTISSMFDEVVVDDFYLADPSDEKLRDNKEAIKSYQSIIGITFESGFDTLSGLQNGLFKNNVQVLDSVLKKYTSTDFNYNQEFDTLYHISSNKLISDLGAIGSDGQPTHQRFLSSRIGPNQYSTQSYLNDRITQTNDTHFASPRLRQDFLRYSVSELQTFSQYTMNVSIPGNSFIKVGELVNIYVPQNSDLVKDKQTYLKLFGQQNPSFLITAVKHNYKSTTAAYTTTFNVMKESFGRQIKSEYASRDRSNEV